jgi:hypothetical protein
LHMKACSDWHAAAHPVAASAMPAEFLSQKPALESFKPRPRRFEF